MTRRLEWKCGLCSHWNFAFQHDKYCVKCGAVRGTGWRSGKKNAPTRWREEHRR